VLILNYQALFCWSVFRGSVGVIPEGLGEINPHTKSPQNTADPFLADPSISSPKKRDRGEFASVAARGESSEREWRVVVQFTRVSRVSTRIVGAEPSQTRAAKQAGGDFLGSDFWGWSWKYSRNPAKTGLRPQAFVTLLIILFCQPITLALVYVGTTLKDQNRVYIVNYFSIFPLLYSLGFFPKFILGHSCSLPQPTSHVLFIVHNLDQWNFLISSMSYAVPLHLAYWLVDFCQAKMHACTWSILCRKFDHM
jgi:hypothetical protein